MENALEKKDQNTAVATEAPPAFGHEQIDAEDIVVPKLLLMQGLSGFVNDGKADIGDLAKYPSAEIVQKADRKEKKTPGVLFIPLTFTKTWVVEEKVGDKYEFRRVEPHTAQNSDAEWDFKEGGTDWRRNKSLDVFGLLAKDVDAEAEIKAAIANGEMPDLSKGLLPVVVSFRRTGYKNGKKIVSLFAKAKKYKVPAYINMFKIGAYQDQNDDGTFWVLDVEEAGQTKKEHLDSCKEWLDVIGAGLRSGRVKVAEEGMSNEGGAETDDEQF
jgi:hypothetical protein